ncbi:hypothetical protein D9757_005746 [Collybiopsis confluens]|uniref:Uncharacterized protein n=1 Tax=Collybiopsis confluens TaxID=2823264 RepID=A0A8H5HQJ1_9AGAR|nr:hypothetical protein D9757_005746 [Collybiopsis confluens]
MTSDAQDLSTMRRALNQSAPHRETNGFENQSVSTSKLEASVKKMAQQAAQYESQMKELESQFSQSLSNFRAIDSLYKEVFTGIKRNSKRADRALNSQIPTIESSLDESVDTLSELAETLPHIQTQVKDVRLVYDSGRAKAQSLIMDLTWLNTSFYERWRRTIFTPSAPVSGRWKVLMRLIFAVLFLMCCTVVWVGALGAYRAYRHKLVWGERLMS